MCMKWKHHPRRDPAVFFDNSTGRPTRQETTFAHSHFAEVRAFQSPEVGVRKRFESKRNREAKVAPGVAMGWLATRARRRGSKSEEMIEALRRGGPDDEPSGRKRALHQRPNDEPDAERADRPLTGRGAGASTTSRPSARIVGAGIGAGSPAETPPKRFRPSAGAVSSPAAAIGRRRTPAPPPGGRGPSGRPSRPIGR